ncbi:MAG: hypothetical protein ISR65_16760 [Bacteriovoracaceae bacterium]|nr:hypothetical protein [Bacteriovoracaceae bacterium]
MNTDLKRKLQNAKKLYYSNTGVSLIGITIAGGLLGMLIMSTTKLITNSTRSLKTTEVNLEINEVMNQARTYLSDGFSCGHTLGVTFNASYPNGEATGGTTYISELPTDMGETIKDKWGDEVTLDGSQLLDLEKVELTNPEEIGDDDHGQLEIVFHFIKTSKLVLNRKVTKRLRVQVKSVDGKIVQCFSATENAITTAFDKVCKELFKGNINSQGECQYVYSWKHSNYSACDPVKKTRNVWCERADGAFVGENYCGGAKPSSVDIASCFNTLSVALTSGAGCPPYCGHSPFEGTYFVNASVQLDGSVNLKLQHDCRYPNKCDGVKEHVDRMSFHVTESASGNFDNLYGGPKHSWKYANFCIYLMKTGYPTQKKCFKN